MTQRRWVPTFGPALIAILSSHDFCNSAAINSNTITVHVCSMTYSSMALGDSKSCYRVLCVFWCPQLTNQLTDLAVSPCIHGHRGQVHKPSHSCSAVGVTRPGCTGAVLTWPPKAIKNQLSHQTRLGKLFLCLQTVAQRGKTSAYKPLPFFLLLTLPEQPVSPWFLCWKSYIPEIKDRQKNQPLPSELNHTTRAGLGILIPLPKPSCSKGSSKEDLTLPSLSVRDALQRLHKTAQYSSKPRCRFAPQPNKDFEMSAVYFLPTYYPGCYFHNFMDYLDTSSKYKVNWDYYGLW